MALCVIPLCSWSSSILQYDSTVTNLNFIGEYTIPHNKSFKETTIGGLSGIDYDRKKGLYYLLSDDRSRINPARFYTAKIYISQMGIDSVQFLDVLSLLQANGQSFPSIKENHALSIDPEGIRFNANTGQLIWTTEGDRIIIEGQQTLLTNPSINISNVHGQLEGTFPLPPSLVMQHIEKGPRQNGALEGIAFNKYFTKMYIAIEEPLYEDGPRADVIGDSFWTRIYQFDMGTKQNTAQYAYQLEAVAYPPSTKGAFKINGISEILFIANNQLLVVERSYSTGRLGCTVKVFIADFSNAQNEITVNSLKENPPVKPMKKRLLLNMDDLEILIDNVEGVTFGPDLPNGHKTLIFITDNNFQSFEKTQFLLFEVTPAYH